MLFCSISLTTAGRLRSMTEPHGITWLEFWGYGLKTAIIDMILQGGDGLVGQDSRRDTVHFTLVSPDSIQVCCFNHSRHQFITFSPNSFYFDMNARTSKLVLQFVCVLELSSPSVTLYRDSDGFS